MLEFVIDKLIGLLGPIATLSKEKREIKDQALRAISIALVETKLYYRDRADGKPRNMDVEHNSLNTGPPRPYHFGTSIKNSP